MRTLTARARQPYTVASLVVLGMGAYFQFERRWGPGFDVWEHAAAVDAFMHNPLHPSHPFLALDAPHPFLTPYHFFVALVGRALFVSPTTAVTLAGVANLALLLVGLKLFVDRLLGHGGATTLVLVFTLFLWGDQPWFFSGFLHSGVLWYVLPYASTFAIAVTLLALALFMRYQEDGEDLLLAVVALMGAFVLLSHQAEALLLYAGMATLAVAHPSRVPIPRQLLVIVGAGVGTLAFAFAWPFFSFRELIFDPTLDTYRTAVSAGNVEMYQHVLRHMWLAGLGVPFVLLRLRRNWRDPVALLTFTATALYAAGWVFDQYLLGRMIAAVVLMLHVALADAIIDAWRAARSVGRPAVPLAEWLVVTVGVLVLFGANLVRQGTAQAVPFATRLPSSFVTADPTPEPLSQLAFLPRLLSRRDLVLSDPLSSFAVPAMSGARIVATVRTFAWVPDDSVHSFEVSRFFDPATPDAVRRQVVDQIRPTHLLVRASLRTDAPAVYGFVVHEGRVVHRDERWVLVAR